MAIKGAPIPSTVCRIVALKGEPPRLETATLVAKNRGWRTLEYANGATLSLNGDSSLYATAREAWHMFVLNRVMIFAMFDPTLNPESVWPAGLRDEAHTAIRAAFTAMYEAGERAAKATD